MSTEYKEPLRWGLIIGSVAGAAVLAFAIYAFTHRYAIATGPDGVVYQTDRLTGKTWRVEGETFKEVVVATPTPNPNAPTELPTEEFIKISTKGDCVYKFGDWRFEGELQNNSDWFISKVKFRVAGEYYEIDYDGVVVPGGKGTLQLDKLKSYTPSEGNPSVKCVWRVYQALGYKPESRQKSDSKASAK
jgi:hypothetical protein